MMGGSSGGGSSAGEIGYPAYMETAHNDWLDDNGTDLMTESIASLMENVITTILPADKPFYNFVTAIPADVMGYTNVMVTPYQAVIDLDALNLTNLFDTFFATLDDAAARAAIVAAEAALLDARMTADILPEFQRGMRDIGAVLTTGFTVGEANMRARDNLSVAKLDAELQLQARRVGWQMSMQWVQLNIDWNRLVATLADEVAIRYIEARYKGDQLDVEMAAKDMLFNLEVYQYGSNVLASIAGATVATKPESSMISTALGGIMSGAASGAAVGSVVPGLGTTAGAIGGALLGLAAAIF
jgi:hypothetical protein